MSPPTTSTAQPTQHNGAVALAPKRAYYKVRNFSPFTCLVDTATAAVIAGIAAVPISIIDYSIMAKVAGKTDSSIKEVWRGFSTLFRSPNKFFFPCKQNHYFKIYCAVSAVYVSTYVFANIARSFCDSINMADKAVGLSVSVSSAVVNIGMTVWKDGVILKVFPPADAKELAIAKAPVPWFSRSMFATRDLLTCVAAFYYAPIVAAYLSQRYRPEEIPLLSSSDWGQIVCPAALQFGSTMIHIVGIRYQKQGGQLTMREGMMAIKKDYVSSVALRICRIIPAFGIGGICNRNLRNRLMPSADGAEPSGAGPAGGTL